MIDVEQTAGAVAISTVGSMRLTLGGVEAPMSSRKALGLIVYLALQPNRSESRERVAAMLWSDSGGEHGRAALRQTLRRLKADLGPAGDLLDADRNMLRLTAPVTIDIVEAAEAATRGEPPALLTRDDADLGRLFADLEDLDQDFNLWVAVQRERLTAQLVGKLEAALAAADSPARRLALAEALTRADPTHEGACRAAMQAHLATGDPIQAMRLYERLWKVLDEDLDVEPSEKTQALYVAIKQGQAQPMTAPAAAAPPEPELLAPIAIVVEPTPVGDLPREFRYIAETFRHEMIGALSRFRDWMVIDGPRNASSPPSYRAYDLRISMQHQQGAVTVATSLNDHASSHCIWSERQATTLEDLVRVQRTTLRNLALALNVHLSASRLQTVREIVGPTGRKYELWLLAQALTNEWRMDARVRAEEILRDLIETNPGFAPAMVALAQNLNVRPIVYPGTPRDPRDLDEALEVSARAVALDPLDARAHLCRYWSYAMAGQHGAALSHLSLALDLNENDPWTIISAGVGFALAGEIERATELVDQARAFGMRHSRAAQGYVATALYLCGDYAGSIEAAEVAGDSMTDLPGWAAASHMRLGNREGAAAAMDSFLRVTYANWVGDAPASEQGAIDWFMGCFPIRDPDVIADLREALLGAAEARRMRRP